MYKSAQQSPHGGRAGQHPCVQPTAIAPTCHTSICIFQYLMFNSHMQSISLRLKIKSVMQCKAKAFSIFLQHSQKEINVFALLPTAVTNSRTDCGHSSCFSAGRWTATCALAILSRTSSEHSISDYTIRNSYQIWSNPKKLCYLY